MMWSSTSCSSFISSLFLLAAGSNASPLGQRAVKCPPGFRNVVFNTHAPRHAGWPLKTWGSLASNGVANWIGFSLSPISANGHYNLASGAPAPTIPSLNAAQIPICMDPLHVAESVALLKSPHPPRYLQLFNEPDHSFKGLTPLTSAANAARAVKPLFDNKPAGTTFVSPALASSDSRYLELFRAACPGCWAKIAIVAAHIYHPIVKDVLAQIRRLHDRFPDKRIWLTEIAPASWVGQGCKLNKQGVIGWMQALMPQIVALGYVDKVFWNAGEWGILDGTSDPNLCNPSLTNEDGSPTDLLKAYLRVCK